MTIEALAKPYVDGDVYGKACVVFSSVSAWDLVLIKTKETVLYVRSVERFVTN